jgi:CTP synthase (UTP-ammonia lyase)
MSAPIKIGILGDFTPEYRSHQTTNTSIEHAAKRLRIDAEFQWIPTPQLLERRSEEMLEGFDGLWASAGSPYKSMAGMLKGIEFARSRDWPFVAT